MKKQTNPYGSSTKKNYKQIHTEQSAASVNREWNSLQNKMRELTHLKNLISRREGHCNVHYLTKQNLTRTHRSNKKLIPSNFSGDSCFYNGEKYYRKIINQNINKCIAKSLPMIGEEINEQIEELKNRLSNMESKISAILYDLNKKINIIGQEHNSQFHHLHLKYEYQQMFNNQHFNTLMQAILNMSDNESIDRHMNKQKKKTSICTILDNVQIINGDTCNYDCDGNEYEENEFEENECEDNDCEENYSQQYYNTNDNFDMNANTNTNTTTSSENADYFTKNNSNNNNDDKNDNTENTDKNDVSNNSNENNETSTTTSTMSSNSSSSNHSSVELVYSKNLCFENKKTEEQNINKNLINNNNTINENNDVNVINNKNDNDRKISDTKVVDSNSFHNFKKSTNELFEKNYINKQKYVTEIFKKTNFDLFKTLDEFKYANANDGDMQQVQLKQQIVLPTTQTIPTTKNYASKVKTK